MGNLLRDSNYRTDLRQAALRRASAIVRAQKQKPTKKPRAAAAKKSD